MRHGLEQFGGTVSRFAVWGDGFTSDEIDQILFMPELQGGTDALTKARVGSNNTEAPAHIRDSDVFWISEDSNTCWLFQRMGNLISSINRDNFLVDIDGFGDFQFTQYKVDQHYTWHMDMGAEVTNLQRKISVVMFLDDPEDYEGGEFEICVNGNLDDITSVKPPRGTIIFFSSWMPHRCKPVLSGTRRTLVTWVMGKRAI